MGWRRLGLVHAPSGDKSWARSHASLPLPWPLGGDVFRVFLSTRAQDQRSSVSFVDVEVTDVPRVVGEASGPVLEPGADGAFDDSGVGVGSLVPVGPDLRLYYMGWNLGVRAPWRNAIGVAILQPPFERAARWSPGPIMDRSPQDPYTLSYPCVMRLAEDDWRAWYGSNLAWGASQADMSHIVKAARSEDGLVWRRDGRPALPFADEGEYAMARPSVARLAGGWLMLFACRGERYRIGAAVSADGETWTRRDDLGLPPSGEGFERETTCYPALFQHRGRLWLAYNGDGFGKTGFGLCVWEGDGPL